MTCSPRLAIPLGTAAPIPPRRPLPVGPAGRPEEAREVPTVVPRADVPRLAEAPPVSEAEV